MSINKQTVSLYMEGFNAGDHAKILSCLTDDVVWDMPGAYHHEGKEAFDKEIENDAFTGLPTITISRLTEEAEVVIAEGAVTCQLKNGPLLNLVFCDVFEMREGKIKKLTSFVLDTKKG
ncbi:MAG: nuclear transport factor 2 family protein [Bacteroidota bacterium]